MFQITEDNLANAIFNNSRIDSTGSGDKLDARIMAKDMLHGYDYKSALLQIASQTDLTLAEAQAIAKQALSR